MTSICLRPSLDDGWAFAIRNWLVSIGVGVQARPLRVQPPPAAEFVETVQTMTTQDMIALLKAKDMPISALSEMLDVERKTIYSWLDDGVEANSGNYERLRAIYDLFAAEADGSLRFYHRFWLRKVIGDQSLKDLIVGREINQMTIRRALDTLRPMVERAMQADASRKAAARKDSPASSLTLHLTAGSSS